MFSARRTINDIVTHVERAHSDINSVLKGALPDVHFFTSLTDDVSSLIYNAICDSFKRD